MCGAFLLLYYAAVRLPPFASPPHSAKITISTPIMTNDVVPAAEYAKTITRSPRIKLIQCCHITVYFKNRTTFNKNCALIGAQRTYYYKDELCLFLDKGKPAKHEREAGGEWNGYAAFGSAIRGVGVMRDAMDFIMAYSLGCAC